jgi:DMSO/TMAO reductase YedYZ molybdopterin-dependent catalytic subunit
MRAPGRSRLRRSPSLRRLPRLPRVSKLPRVPALSDPPGPFRASFWKSPLRGEWLTSMLGSILFVLIAVVAVTGLISHSAYQPDLVAGYNATVPTGGDIGPLISLPASSPAWAYALSQGAHITVGLIAIPVLLAKLWSVIPRLFAYPPARDVAGALERLAVLLLVGSGLFEFATGVLDMQVFYPFHFGFVLAHYYGAWVFICALALHILVKLPTVRRAYRTHGVLGPLKDDLAHTRPEPAVPGSLAPTEPAAATISRRGLLGLVGAGSLALLLANLGESVGGPLRQIALLAPRGRVFGTGPNAFQINKTADTVGVTKLASDPRWRLEVSAARASRRLSRAELMAMAQHTYAMPIACVEGWSTTQHWTGVRLRDLAALVDASQTAILEVHSLQPSGPFIHTAYSAGQVQDERALLALCVNGVDLSIDHGYPARVIIPAVPGVHCTKWVASAHFLEA